MSFRAQRIVAIKFFDWPQLLKRDGPIHGAVLSHIGHHEAISESWAYAESMNAPTPEAVELLFGGGGQAAKAGARARDEVERGMRRAREKGLAVGEKHPTRVAGGGWIGCECRRHEGQSRLGSVDPATG